MGFFSYDCRGCGHPLLAPHATNSVNAWMTDAVCLLPDGRVVKGAYDGYGRLDGEDVRCGERLLDAPEAWHRACWEACGSPTKFTRHSAHADDQGHFFPEGAHDLPVSKAGGSVREWAGRPVQGYRLHETPKPPSPLRHVSAPRRPRAR